MPVFRIKEAASLLGVSSDTLRRWADAGRIQTTSDASGGLAVDGAVLAGFACELADSGGRWVNRAVSPHSLQNRFSGLVSRVVRDSVLAQVEIQAGRTGSCRCSAARLPTSWALSQEYSQWPP